MANKVVELIKRNVITAFVIVALPIIAALAVTLFVIVKGYHNGWGYGYAAILVALVVQYPYLKIADRYFFK